MNLEDHLGDILRKARLMKGLSPAAVASAGGLTEPELAALENTGSGLAHQNLATLASLLELNPGKLDSIARGWVPSVKDLGAWRELRQISTTEAGNTVHCYLIWDEVTRDGIQLAGIEFQERRQGCQVLMGQAAAGVFQRRELRFGQPAGACDCSRGKAFHEPGFAKDIAQVIFEVHERTLASPARTYKMRVAKVHECGSLRPDFVIVKTSIVNLWLPKKSSPISNPPVAGARASAPSSANTTSRSRTATSLK